MEWIILFIISWLLFLLLVDWKKLKINIWNGLFAFLYQLAVDALAKQHHLYHIVEPIICLFGSSLFFGLGPVLVIGILLAQYHPEKKLMMIINVMVLTVLYSLQELLLQGRHVLVYDNWHFHDSLFLNFTVLIALSWFSMVVLRKGVFKG